jgi:hypothetical protein
MVGHELFVLCVNSQRNIRQRRTGEKSHAAAAFCNRASVMPEVEAHLADVRIIGAGLENVRDRAKRCHLVDVTNQNVSSLARLGIECVRSSRDLPQGRTNHLKPSEDTNKNLRRRK